MRTISLIATLAASTCIVATAHAQQTSFNVRGGSLKSAIDAYARQSRRPVVYKADDLRNARSSGYSGIASPSDALDAILANSGFLAKQGASGSVAIVRVGNGARADDDRPSSMQDIVVTAQKREERLKDVPVPVTAVTGNALLDKNQTKAEDFFSSIPGVNLQTTRNRSNLAIRGITTGPVTGNPIVGYTIDDIPYGSSTGQGGLFGGAPDIDPSELARIEVLRGPQGTLYGASSMGGLVKYVTIDPSTDRVSGAVAAGLSTINHAGDVGYNVRASVNIPVSDTLAFRVGGFSRQDPGYIDNVVTGKQDVNKIRVSGVRGSVLWRPSDAFSAKLGALYQDRKAFGSANVDVRLGSRYLQSDLFGAGNGYSKNQLYSAVLEGQIGVAKITSLTAYSMSKSFDFADFSAAPLTGVWPGIYPDAGVTNWGTTLPLPFDVKKFSQEARVAVPFGEAIDVIVGAFYTHESVAYDIDTGAVDADTGTVIGNPIIWRDRFKFKEYAGFANVTVRLSKSFDVQGGLRYSENRQRMHHREMGVFTPGGFLEAVYKSSGHALTYQITPRFKVSPDHMIYGRFATGYRPGGPNATCDISIGIPCQYKADETVNYEIGAKGDFFARAFSYDLSIFTIDWKDIQVTQVSPGGTFTYNANANRARSRGVELSLEARPEKGLTLAVWGSYTDAELRESFSQTVAVYGAKGDRLPFSSRYSGRASANYESSLGGDLTGSIGGSATYVGLRRGEFVATLAQAPLRQNYPSYVQVDLNAGVKYQDWKLNMFVQNATNKKALIGGGFNNQYNFNPNWFNYIQPRTIGFTLERKF